MIIDPKFVELAADAVRIIVYKIKNNVQITQPNLAQKIDRDIFPRNEHRY